MPADIRPIANVGLVGLPRAQSGEKNARASSRIAASCGQAWTHAVRGPDRPSHMSQTTAVSNIDSSFGASGTCATFGRVRSNSQLSAVGSCVLSNRRSSAAPSWPSDSPRTGDGPCREERQRSRSAD